MLRVSKLLLLALLVSPSAAQASDVETEQIADTYSSLLVGSYVLKDGILGSASICESNRADLLSYRVCAGFLYGSGPETTVLDVPIELSALVAITETINLRFGPQISVLELVGWTIIGITHLFPRGEPKMDEDIEETDSGYAFPLFPVRAALQGGIDIDLTLLGTPGTLGATVGYGGLAARGTSADWTVPTGWFAGLQIGWEL